ncbi:hypothetical protein CLAFUW4_07219 [Fulvia fulva]|uniref:Epoxide hydrolase N-terminal domain-containing protein n=1 Tax=Passalora fulva TaxID=5499 RepID=A0A9Q8PAC7_PASFU|nr:uncharacterized protein CLAFUR5_07352 [Fulvia fulva]KAK4621556.1 hypothetical protein CLAFUR4_07227 [Fulvia fulva]KAK4623186.1 hypothetical protein CLAFUR0_07224 [Fulvia fulva]UJO18830.1 hypothetical protein CLAFUR5_07352 [Fulvia fulva]WPV16768.1 hypothetical protein CLAFUW4_07219 [Fulvia fulva]WPV31374.1 hypothetical protein CLAFUW7_07220 [Fulvia fulva]
MARSAYVLWLCLTLSVRLEATGTGGLLRSDNTSFADSPVPFSIQVYPDFIEQLRERVKGTRPPVQVKNEKEPGADGPTIANASTVRDFWVEQYDLNTNQASINSRYAPWP